MKVTDPIKEDQEIQQFKNYYLRKGALRNYALIILGLYTALRISDILSLKWGDVYKFTSGSFNKYIYLTEQKTGKLAKILLNQNIFIALKMYFDSCNQLTEDTFIFKSREGGNKAISRIQAHRIIKEAAMQLGMDGNIACHSLRKTFGYQAWKNNVPGALIMDIFNHSSFEITKRYLCISQEDKDNVFNDIKY